MYCSENVIFNSHYYRSGVWSVIKKAWVYQNVKSAGEFSRKTEMYLNIPEWHGSILDRLEHWGTNGSHLNFLKFTWNRGEIRRRFLNTPKDIIPVFWNNATIIFCAVVEQYCVRFFCSIFWKWWHELLC